MVEETVRDLPGHADCPAPSAAVRLEKAPKAILPWLLLHAITGQLSTDLADFLAELPGALGQGLRGLAMTLGLSLNAATACILYSQAVAVLDDRPASAGVALRGTLRAWRGILAYSAVSMITVVLFFQLAFHAMDKLHWLAVTLVILACVVAKLAFTLPLLVLEGLPLFDAFRTSWRRTRGYLLPLIGYSLLSWFTVFLLFEPWKYLVSDGPLRETLNTFSLQLTPALWTLVSATYYHRSRSAPEQNDL